MNLTPTSHRALLASALATIVSVPAIAVAPSVSLVAARRVAPSEIAAYYGAAVTHTNGLLHWTSGAPEINALARALGGGGRLSTDAFASQVFDYVRDNISTEMRFGLGKGARGAVIDQSGTPFDQAELMVKILRQGGVASAKYEYGTITLGRDDFARWSGLFSTVTGTVAASQTTTVDAGAACTLLAQGGIPAQVNGQGAGTTCASLNGTQLSTVILQHVWVEVGGKRYDPSFKRHTLFPGVTNLFAAMGCGTTSSTCGSGATTALTTGYVTGTLGSGGTSVRTVRTLNETSLDTTLSTYASNLANYIRNSANNIERYAPIEAVIGGKIRDKLYNPVPGTALPYPSSTPVVWTGDMPDQFRTTVRVQLLGADHTLYLDETYGRDLSLLTYEYTGTTRYTGLIKDGESSPFVGWVTSTVTATTRDDVTVTFNHPYAADAGTSTALTGTFADEAQVLYGGEDFVDDTSATYPAAYANNITLVLASGDTGIGLQNLRHPARSVPTGLPFPPGSFPSGGWSAVQNSGLRDAQRSNATQFLVQEALAAKVLAGVSKTAITSHHKMGVAFGSFSPIGGSSTTQFNIVSATSMANVTNVANDRAAAFEAYTTISTAIEGTTLQQAEDGLYSLSAPYKFFSADSDNQRFLLVTCANWTTANSTLGSGTYRYSAARLSALNAMACTDQLTLIVPERSNYGGATLDQIGFQGTESAEVGFGAFGTSGASKMTFTVAERLKGSSAKAGNDPLESALAQTKLGTYSLKDKNSFSFDSVSGALTLSPPADISIGQGSFPESLSFKRTYSSANVLDKTCGNIYYGATPVWTCSYSGDGSFATRLPGGWKHNFEMSASWSNSGLEAFGVTSALRASTAVATTFAAYDAARGVAGVSGATALNRLRAGLTTTFATNYLMRAMVKNVMTINLPERSLLFTQIPLTATTNAWDAPTDAPSAKLSYTGAVAYISQGGKSQGSYGGIVVTYESPRGELLTFSPFRSSTYFVAGSNPPPPQTVVRPEFTITQWASPDGVTATFNYTSQTLSMGPDLFGTVSILSSVENTLGRKLYIGITTESELSRITSVSDAPSGGRTIAITPTYDDTSTVPECGRAPDPNFVESQRRSDCPTILRVQNADSLTTYDYRFSVDSPNTVTRQEARSVIRLWQTPAANSSTASQNYLTFKYDELNRVTEVKDLDANVTKVYSASVSTEIDKLGEIVDPINASTRIYADQFGKPEIEIDALGRVTTHEYNRARQRVKSTFPELNYTVSAYDARSNLLSTTSYPKPGSPLTPLVASTTYGEAATVSTCANLKTCNKPLTETDARNNQTSYSWDSTSGLLTSITSPSILIGGQSETPFTSFGYTGHAGTSGTVQKLMSKVDRIRQLPSVQTVTTSYTYKPVAQNLVLDTATVDSGGLNLSTSLTFDTVGNLSTVDGPRSDVVDVTTYTFDALRRLTKVSAPLNSIMRYSYDRDGQLTSTRRALVANPTDSNPADPRPTDLIAAQWQSVARDYWPDGNLKTIIDPEGFTTVHTYDATDRLVYLTQQEGAGVDRVTRYVYDAAGQKTQEYRGWGTADQLRYGQWTYTANGKVDLVDDPISVAAGQLSTAWLARTDLQYDGFDRLYQTKMPDPLSGSPSATDYEQYGYDANGNLTSKRNRSGVTVTMAYNALNQETQRVVPDNAAVAGNYARTLDSSYDLLGRKLTMAAEGQTITNVWDKPGRLDLVTDVYNGNSYVVDSSYDPAGNRTGMTWPGGGSLTYQYDALNRMTNVIDNNGAVTLAHYDYDILSRRDLATFGNGTSSDPNYYLDDALQSLNLTGGGRSALFSYTRNRVNQITGLSVTAPTAGNWSEATFLQKPAAANSTAYVPDKLNRYSTVGGTAYTYDGNANLTSDGVYTFTYDEENRLRTASGAGSSVTYTYDPAGRRRAKAVTGTYAGTTIYLSDGVEEIEERDGSNALLRRYAYGSSIDDRIAMLDSALCGSRCYYQTNHQGSTIGLSNQAGTLIDAYGYDAYGRSNASATGNPFRYTGRRFDPETGLYYYRARYYSTNIGRFLQVDPIGTKDDLNLYAYTYNDPTNRTDPTGLAGGKNPETGEYDGKESDKKGTAGVVASEASKAGDAAQHVQSGAQAVQGGAEGRGLLAASKKVPKALAVSVAAAKIASKSGPVGAAANVVKATAQLVDGQPRKALNTGLQAAESAAGAAAGAALGAATGPLAPAAVPTFAAVGAFAPELLEGPNDAISNSHPLDTVRDIIMNSVPRAVDFIPR
jgi:RHS repeat-associated protein